MATGRSAEVQAGGEGEKEGFLHLYSDEKMWAVKQVSTSNSVHVARTVSAEELERVQKVQKDEDGDGDLDMDEGEELAGDNAAGDLPKVAGGISAISQVKHVLELIEVKPDDAHLERMLRDILPIFPDADTEDDHSPASNPQTQPSAQDLFANLPFPTTTISSTMTRLFAFGHKPSREVAQNSDPIPGY